MPHHKREVPQRSNLHACGVDIALPKVPAAFFASGNCFNWILLDHQIISDCRIIKYLIDMHQMLLLELKQLLLLLHAAYFPVFPLLLIFQCSHGAGLFKAVAWPALNPAMPGMAD